MNLSSARATFGLFSTAAHTSIGVTGDAQIGTPNTPLRFPAANVIHQLRAIFANPADILQLNMDTGATTGSTAWVGGNYQLERATAVGTITLAGNASAIVTAAGMAGSPRTITFAVAFADTPVLWAAKARAALLADGIIAAKFDVGGTGALIEMTPKYVSFTIPESPYALSIFKANDATLNIALANVTSAGITGAPTSSNTLLGVASVGCKIYDGDGKDFEGVELPSLGDFYGFLLQAEGGPTNFDGVGTDFFTLAPGEVLLRAAAGGISSDRQFTITSTASAALTVTVIGDNV